MNISFERILGTKPCNNKNYYTILVPRKSDKFGNNVYCIQYTVRIVMVGTVYLLYEFKHKTTTYLPCYDNLLLLLVHQSRRLQLLGLQKDLRLSAHCSRIFTSCLKSPNFLVSLSQICYRNDEDFYNQIIQSYILHFYFFSSYEYTSI